MMWSWRKNLYLLYSAATYFCFLLVLLGLASSTWAENGTTQSGLLSYCSHDGDGVRHACGSVDYGDRDVWFDVCRTFCLLSAVLLFTIVPLSCYLHYEDERKEDVTLLTVFGVFTGVVGLVGAIVYAALWDKGGLAWGFALFVAGHVTAVIMYLSLCVISHTQPAPKTARITPFPAEPRKP